MGCNVQNMHYLTFLLALEMEVVDVFQNWNKFTRMGTLDALCALEATVLFLTI